jgi:hypothetical protein
MTRQNLLANQAQGAEGKRPQHFSRPNLLGWIFQVAPFRKSNISERQQTSTTSQAARLYGTHFLGDEPLLETNKCPPFRNSMKSETLGLSPANARPATITGNFFEKAHGALVAWERLNRSRPQAKPESDKIGGI